MTNLMRWLMYLGLFAIPYFAIVLEKIQSPLLSDWMFEIQISPFVIVFLFGIYSIVVVVYRALSIRDCPEAAKELQEEIEEARRDLIARGFQFRD